ncbi:MAG: MerR family DNA-binding transcriptional regulator [Candidatus Eisenbacteria bacterium]|nr:MerR family DNA-binding transcriptional regulator [Candidatus Eisenbacteria bacterium]
MMPRKSYSTAEVAERAGVSRDTILRWLKDGKVPEPGRDRNGWRVFGEEELSAVLRHARKTTPAPGREDRSTGAPAFAQAEFSEKDTHGQNHRDRESEGRGRQDHDDG